MRRLSCISSPVPALLTLLFLAACAPTEPPSKSPREAWSFHDLEALCPDLPVAEDVARARVDTDTIRQRTVSSIQTPVGASLGWTLQLGKDPFLTFRPIAIGECVFRVFVGEHNGKWHDVWQGRFEGERKRTYLPRPVEVDLSQWSDETIEVWLRIAATGGCQQARWASPVIFERRTFLPPAPPERPDILLLGLDTLRTDALGIYGRDPSVTPSLDRFGAESDVFLEAFSANNSTNPGFTSLMTGLHSRDHGIYDQRTRVSASANTMAELFSEAGYTTRAVVSARHVGRASGLDQGFGQFLHPPRQQFFAETVIQKALAWIQADGVKENRPPTFTFLHLFDAHIPHNPPAPFSSGSVPRSGLSIPSPEEWFAFRETGLLPLKVQSPIGLEGHVDAYPGEVAYLDRQLGRLFAFLESRGVLEHTLVAIVADHGETLGEEEKFFDHDGLIDPVTHVPLIVRWPGQTEGRRRSGLVQHLDLFPTLLQAAGISPPETQVGRSLSRTEEDAASRRVVVSEAANHQGTMARTTEWKLIELPKGEIRLYDLRSDPGEAVNRAGEGLAIEEELRELLVRWRRDQRPLEAAEAVALTPEEEAELEALGYTN